MVRVRARSPDRWASVTQHRTPRASAAAANPGQRSSSRVSGQLTCARARLGARAGRARLTVPGAGRGVQAGQGVQPGRRAGRQLQVEQLGEVGMAGRPDHRLGLAPDGRRGARAARDLPRHQPDQLVQRPGGGAAGHVEQLTGPVGQVLCRHAASCPAVYPRPCHAASVRLPNYCRMAHYSYLATARRDNPEVETGNSPVQGDQLRPVTDGTRSARRRRPGLAADRQQDRT